MSRTPHNRTETGLESFGDLRRSYWVGRRNGPRIWHIRTVPNIPNTPHDLACGTPWEQAFPGCTDTRHTSGYISDYIKDRDAYPEVSPPPSDARCSECLEWLAQHDFRTACEVAFDPAK